MALVDFDFESILKYVDNPIAKAVLAAGGTTAIIAATTAFAPIGVVGAAGWTLVYCVFGGTMTLDVAKRLWDTYQKMTKEQRDSFNVELDKLKRMLDEGVITKEQFDMKAEKLFDKCSV